jgi:hypothetical protein
VLVSARLVRSGLRGSVEAVRDLILGPRPNQRTYPVSFEIPTKLSPGGLARLLRML